MIGEHTIAVVLEEAARSLRPHRPRTPRLDAEVLLAHVLGCDRTRLYALAGHTLAPHHLLAFETLLARRKAGEPVAYIVGRREFFGRTLLVSPCVLIPRAETETLVEAALDLLRRRAPVCPRVLEIGTGSGAVAVALATEIPSLRVVATDICPLALGVARENTRTQRVGDRVELIQADVFESPSPLGRFDLVVSNPPYVGTVTGPAPEPEVLRHEPILALFAGPDGLEVIRRIVAGAPRHLVDGGALALEAAPSQVERVEHIMLERGLRHTRILADLSGLPRVVAGIWEEA